ncbi:MAG: alpha/beta hydrolase, partial [Terriglobia bacterium]
SAATLKQIRVPVLVAHCRQDPVIPFALGEELYAAANQPKTFLAYDAFCHEPLFIADPEDYAARLQNFFRVATR